MGNETGNVISGIHNKVCRTARREVMFVMKKLAQILPTSKTCYLVSCAGRSCIIDEFKSPENGSRVLISTSGRYEWGTTLFFPWRIVADTGEEIYGEAQIIGTVTHEIQRVGETTE